MSLCGQLNLADKHGRTALHYACMSGKTLIVCRLLSEPQFRSAHDRDGYGFTSLMYAAMKPDSTEVVRALITDAYEGHD